MGRTRARDIELKVNNTFIREPCAICGALIDDKGRGVDVFAAGTWARVCEPCADARRPGLALAGEALSCLLDHGAGPHVHLVEQLAAVVSSIPQSHLDEFASHLRERALGSNV
jgi:hypothetical protein